MENTKSKNKYYMTRHKYYEKNKTAFKKYYEKNKNEIIERNKEYYKNNKPTILRKQKQYNINRKMNNAILKRKQIPIIKYADKILVSF